jgi:hypothetical protein
VTANESATIGDIRTVISAEATYHTANGGFYGEITCLTAPSTGGCIPSYPTNGPTFLDSQIAALVAKSGYNRSFDQNLLPGGVSCYTYHATPSVQNQTGVRGFAGDCSGRICFTPSGSAVPTVSGALLPTCNALTQ